MKKLFALIFTIFLAATTAANASNPPSVTIVKKGVSGFDAVPRGHWVYEGASILAAAGIIEPSIQSRLKAPTGVTRYEFAIWTVQVLDSQTEKFVISPSEFEKAVRNKVKADGVTIRDDAGKERKITSLECVDILRAMALEFDDELHVLGLTPPPRRSPTTTK